MLHETGSQHGDSPSLNPDSDHSHARNQAHSHPGLSRAHDHGHAVRAYDLAFLVGLSLNLLFVVAETGFGVRSGSLALVADAGHNLTDVLALGLAWGATAMSRRAPSTRRTY